METIDLDRAKYRNDWGKCRNEIRKIIRNNKKVKIRVSEYFYELAKEKFEGKGGEIICVKKKYEDWMIGNRFVRVKYDE